MKITASSEGIDYNKIREVHSALSAALDIVDSMNDKTYFEMSNLLGDRFYEDLCDDVRLTSISR